MLRTVPLVLATFLLPLLAPAAAALPAECAAVPGQSPLDASAQACLDASTTCAQLDLDRDGRFAAGFADARACPDPNAACVRSYFVAMSGPAQSNVRVCHDVSAVCASVQLTVHFACVRGVEVGGDGTRVAQACAIVGLIPFVVACANGVETNGTSASATDACVSVGAVFFFWGAVPRVCAEGAAADEDGASVASACALLDLYTGHGRVEIACARPAGVDDGGVAATCVSVARIDPRGAPLVTVCPLG